MPTTIVSTSGNSYHLFQLSEPSYWEPSESIRFEELENDLGDGYYSQSLYGSSTGLRSWKLKLGTLANTDVLPNTVTDVSGALVSREEYLWNLFCHTKVTGEPFVFVSPRNGQYYLVRFADKELSYQKMRVKIYSTGVELKQVRIPGESIFVIDPNLDGMAGLEYWLKESGHSTPTWTKAGGSITGNSTASGDVIFDAATQNGLNIVRLNSVGTNGKIVLPGPASTNPTVGWEIFIVMKVREATFGQTSGILSTGPPFPGGSGSVIEGVVGTTKFSGSDANFEYRLNGVEYADADRQAPMSRFGVVHFRHFGFVPYDIPKLQIGQKSDTLGDIAGTQAEIDIAEYFTIGGILSDTVLNDVTEYLTVKWGIT